MRSKNLLKGNSILPIHNEHKHKLKMILGEIVVHNFTLVTLLTEDI